MEISYHGHSVVKITTATGMKLMIDPFITGNPLCDLSLEDIELDYILVTHAHEDHLGDTIALAQQTKAKVISVLEICDYLESQGIENVHGLQPGGGYDFDFGRFTLTPAIHGSSLTINGLSHTLGLASGILLEIEGKTIYHLGDTALFSDLQLIGDLHDISLAFIPIGDNFTMGPKDAVLAANWLMADKVVPIHYNTFDLIKQDPQAFIDQLPPGIGYLPEIGQVFSLD